MKREQIKKASTVFFAIVTVTALFTAFITTSQHASAARIIHHKVAVQHKDHIASSQTSATAVVVHHIGHTASQGTISVHKVVAVIPETHGAQNYEIFKR
jgi:hypothetical protein